MPPKIGVHPRTDAFLHAMPAYLRELDVVAMKWVAGFPDNPARGLAAISGLIIVNEPETGVPIAVLDAAEITAARTAAASGACVQAFAPAGWSTAAVLGCGEQGRYHCAVLRALSPECEIRAYDPVAERARDVCEGAIVAAEARAAVDGADVVVSAGPIVRKPPSPLDESWIGGDVLLLPIDFDFYVSAQAVTASDLFLTDDVPQFEAYREHGYFRGWPAPDASVGDALERGLGARRVVCANLGVGALDAAFAHAVLSRIGD
jgi:ornithine cyclodeaminase/alanine dehydrogenase